MGGRGSSSGITKTNLQPQSSIPRNYQMLAPSDVDQIAADAEDTYDINTVLAIQQYIRQDQQQNGFTMSQNMNHKLETDQKLNANEEYTKKKLIDAMAPIGKDTILTRAAHKDFLEALGVQNYQNMSATQLDAAVKGAEYTEKKFVSAAFDPSKNPFISGPVSGGREVYIKIKTPSDTKMVIGNKQQSEAILSPGVKFRATGAHFDGTMAHPRNGGTLPRVIVEVEIIK